MIGFKSMLTRTTVVAILCACASSFNYGCTRFASVVSSDTNDSMLCNKENEYMINTKYIDYNAQLIQTSLCIDRDGALGAAETLSDFGVGQLETIEPLDGMEYTAQVIDTRGRSYILEFSQTGYLQVIRSGSLEGEVLFCVID